MRSLLSRLLVLRNACGVEVYRPPAQAGNAVAHTDQVHTVRLRVHLAGEHAREHLRVVLAPLVDGEQRRAHGEEAEEIMQPVREPVATVPHRRREVGLQVVLGVVHPHVVHEVGLRGRSDQIIADRDPDARLRDEGWLPLRVWEHDDPDQAALTIHTAVKGRSIRR